jgi:hypothetical protein
MAQQQMSLFGPSLAQAQAGLMQEDEAITSKLAQLTPEQQLTRVALQGGRQAGRALGGLFGIEDPRLKEAAQQEAIFKELKDSGVDFKDPEKLYSALSDAYQARGMVDKAIVTAAKLEDIKSSKLKTRLTEAQIKSAEGVESRAQESAKMAAERYDYEKGQRAFEEAKKQVDFVKSVQDVTTKSMQAEAAKIALDKAKAELEAMPEGYFKKQFELKLEKLDADIKASKALATYRERPPRSDQLRKMAEIPVRDDLGNVVGKTIVYSDGTQETVMGNQPAQGDVAAQTARGVNPNSTDFMEQLRAQALAERKRRQQAAGAK